MRFERARMRPSSCMNAERFGRFVSESWRAECRAARVADRDAAAQHPAIGASGRLNPVFVLEVRRLAGQVRAERRAKTFDLVGMHAIEPVEQRVADFFIAETQHR